MYSSLGPSRLTGTSATGMTWMLSWSVPLVVEEYGDSGCSAAGGLGRHVPRIDLQSDNGLYRDNLEERIRRIAE